MLIPVFFQTIIYSPPSQVLLEQDKGTAGQQDHILPLHGKEVLQVQREGCSD